MHAIPTYEGFLLFTEGDFSFGIYFYYYIHAYSAAQFTHVPALSRRGSDR